MTIALRRTRRLKPAHAGSGKTPPRKSAGQAAGGLCVLEPAKEQEALPLLEEWLQVPCPCCGEELEVLVRSDEDGQTRYETCSVCRQNATLHITWDDGELQVEASRAQAIPTS